MLAIIVIMSIIIVLETLSIYRLNKSHIPFKKDIMDLSRSVDEAQVILMDMEHENIIMSNKLTRIRRCNNQSSQMKMYYKRLYTELKFKINK